MAEGGEISSDGEMSWPETSFEESGDEQESGDELVAENRAAAYAYQNEPLAAPGENERRAQEVDQDGLSAATLDSRLEGEIPLDDWCKCNHCHTELLVNAREYRCCQEVGPAIGKLQFDGNSENISCITQHQEYIDMTKRVVLEHVGPLLQDQQGRRYKRRAGEDINVFLRAVSYRWIVRWMCGYLGWEHARPLSACVYSKIRTEYSAGRAHGYMSSEERQ